MFTSCVFPTTTLFLLRHSAHYIETTTNMKRPLYTVHKLQNNETISTFQDKNLFIIQIFRDQDAASDSGCHLLDLKFHFPKISLILLCYPSYYSKLNRVSLSRRYYQPTTLRVKRFQQVH